MKDRKVKYNCTKKKTQIDCSLFKQIFGICTYTKAILQILKRSRLDVSTGKATVYHYSTIRENNTIVYVQNFPAFSAIKSPNSENMSLES